MTTSVDARRDGCTVTPGRLLPGRGRGRLADAGRGGLGVAQPTLSERGPEARGRARRRPVRPVEVGADADRRRRAVPAERAKPGSRLRHRRRLGRGHPGPGGRHRRIRDVQQRALRAVGTRPRVPRAIPADPRAGRRRELGAGGGCRPLGTPGGGRRGTADRCPRADAERGAVVVRGRVLPSRSVRDGGAGHDRRAREPPAVPARGGLRPDRPDPAPAE